MRAFFHSVDGRDIGMIERREHLGFPLEARHALGVVRERLRQDFDRHVAAQLGIGGAIDFAHPAFAELGGDAIMRDGFLWAHSAARGYFAASRFFALCTLLRLRPFRHGFDRVTVLRRHLIEVKVYAVFNHFPSCAVFVLCYREQAVLCRWANRYAQCRVIPYEGWLPPLYPDRPAGGRLVSDGFSMRRLYRKDCSTNH